MGGIKVAFFIKWSDFRDSKGGTWGTFLKLKDWINHKVPMFSNSYISVKLKDFTLLKMYLNYGFHLC